MSKTYNNGIITTAGFQFNANMPLDDRLVVDTLDDLLSITSYDGMIVYVKEKDSHYTKTNDGWTTLASTATDDTGNYVQQQTGPSEFRRVYGVETDGEQTMFNIVAHTDKDGNSADDKLLVSKKYVDDTRVEIMKPNGSSSQLYAIDPNGNPKQFSVSIGSKPGAVAIYDSTPGAASGALRVREEPTSNNEATSKQYVDTKVSEVRSAANGKVSKVDNTNGVLGDGHSVVYAAKVDGQDSYFPLTFGRYKEGCVLAYDENGYIEVNVPQSIADDGKFVVNKEWVRNYNRDVIKSPNFIKNASYATSTDPNYGVMTAYGDNKAQGFASAAFGELNYIEGDKISGSPKGGSDSLAAGARNRITGNGGKAALLGLSNIATASCAFAGNRYNTVKAVSAFSLGERNQVAGKAAGALGKGLTVTNDKQVAVGSYNAPNESAVFIVGNGRSNRQNAMTVQKDGTLTLGGHFDENYTEVLDISKAAKYLYTSTAGDVNLYKICDCQTEDEETLIRSWLINAKFTKDGTEYIIDEKSVIEPGTDARKNLVVKDNKVIVLCVVESIDPYNMPAMTELGIYVNPDYIDAVQFSKWIDEPYTADMSGYVTDEQLESVINAIEDINVGKLDQAAGNKSYSQAYTVDSEGNQTTTPLSFDTMAGTIPRRLIGTNHEGLSEDGHINVPYEPTGAGHATSKTYVDRRDERIEGLVADCVQQEKTKADYSRLYGVKRSGEQQIYNIISEPAYVESDTGEKTNYWPSGGVVARLGKVDGAEIDESGQIIVPKDPTSDLCATSRTYVHGIRDAIYNSRSLEAAKNNSVVIKTDPSSPELKNTVESKHTAVFGTRNVVHSAAHTSLVSGNANRISKGNGKNAIFGLRNLADTDTGFIGNRYNIGRGTAPFTLGERNQVLAANAGAFGTRLIADKASQIAVGKLNARSDDAVFIVGNGSSVRSNAITVKDNGTITVGGYDEDIMLSGPVNSRDNFTHLGAGTNVGVNDDAIINGTGYVNSGNFSAKITAYDDKTIYAKVSSCTVKKDHSYSVIMNVAKNTGTYPDFTFVYGILDENGTVTDICEGEHSCTSNNFETVERKTFTANVDGTLVVGIVGFETSGPDAAKRAFYVAQVKLTDNTPSALVYNYKSTAGPGNHTQILYRISDTPCDGSLQKLREFFKGKTVETTFGNIVLTEDDITNDEAWVDEVSNILIRPKHPSAPGTYVTLACVVDRIDPTTMTDVTELGLYVNPQVTSFPGVKWVDRTFASEHTDGGLIIRPDYIFDTKEVSTTVINANEINCVNASVSNLDVGTIEAENIEISGGFSTTDITAVNVNSTGGIETSIVNSNEIHTASTFTDALCVSRGISYGTEYDMEQLENPKLGQLFIIVEE